MNDVVKEVPLEQGFVMSKYRESRDQDGRLTYLTKQAGLELLRGKEVFNTELSKIEIL